MKDLWIKKIGVNYRNKKHNIKKKLQNKYIKFHKKFRKEKELIMLPRP